VSSNLAGRASTFNDLAVLEPTAGATVSAQCPRYLFGNGSGVIGPPERERPRAVGNTVEAIGSDTKSDYPTTARPASGCAS
jgi:hypothetical protein